MYERFTQQARCVIFFARFEASQLQSDYVDPEHFLLALMQEDCKLFESTFAWGGEKLAQIRAEIEQGAKRDALDKSNVDLPLGYSTKVILANAGNESNRLKSPIVGTDILLLGMLMDQASPATQILVKHGVQIDDARKKIEAKYSQSSRLPNTIEIGSYTFNVGQRGVDELLRGLENGVKPDVEIAEIAAFVLAITERFRSEGISLFPGSDHEQRLRIAAAEAMLAGVTEPAPRRADAPAPTARADQGQVGGPK